MCLAAFKEKVRAETRAGRSDTNPETYSARVKLGYEVAAFLLKNVVQGVKVGTATSVGGSEGQDLWSE